MDHKQKILALAKLDAQEAHWKDARRHKANAKAPKKRTVIHVAALPVTYTVHAIARVVPHNKETGKFVMGVGLMLTGSALAMSGHHIVEAHAARIAWDTLSYGIHGIGLAPVLKVIGHKLKIEL
jgi:hypothetical protein